MIFDKRHYINIVLNPVALKALFRIPTYQLNNLAVFGDTYISTQSLDVDFGQL